MADQGKLIKQASRGERAKKERQGKLIDDFFVQAKDACHKVWAGSDDRDVRENAWMRLQAIEDVELCYRKTIEDGKFARNELLRLQQENENE